MTSCEKCWNDAQLADDVAGEYQRLIRSRPPCSAEEQAGPYASRCLNCGQLTRHQHTGECMACHSKEPTK